MQSRSWLRTRLPIRRRIHSPITPHIGRDTPGIGGSARVLVGVSLPDPDRECGGFRGAKQMEPDEIRSSVRFRQAAPRQAARLHDRRLGSTTGGSLAPFAGAALCPGLDATGRARATHQTVPLKTRTCYISRVVHRDVFAPTSLGPITLRNAVIKSATFEGAAPGGQVSDRLVEFHRALARGGVGATTVAYLAVSSQGRTHRDQICLRDGVPGLRRLTDAIHAEGAAAIGQIGHAGPVANGRSNGVKALSAWRMPSPLSMQMIRTATEADLARIAGDYVAGARKAVDSGFDALEIHLGHGYLLSSFLSPNLNKCKDSRNGSLENRASFPRDVVRRIREAVPGAASTELEMT